MQKLEVSTSVEACNRRVPKQRGKKGVPKSPLGEPPRWQVIQEINNGLKVMNPNINRCHTEGDIKPCVKTVQTKTTFLLDLYVIVDSKIYRFLC